MANIKSKLPLWLMLALFSLPPIIAYIVYINIDKLRFNTTQQGHLITPPFVIQQPSASPWQIIYLTPNYCDTSCTLRKHELAQLQKALGKNSSRVIVLYNTANTLPVVYYTDSVAKALIEDNVLIVDPQGKAVMCYRPWHQTTAILRDIRHLLKNSRIG